MTGFTLYLLDITQAGGTNGVDRYISCLLEALAAHPAIQPVHIQLCMGSSCTRIDRTTIGHYIRITVPLPEKMGNVINKQYWSKKYCETLFRLIKPCFEETGKKLLHIHTLNLIDLALEIKRHTGAKVITHLHCIPWKSLFNEDEDLFNRLYRLYYLKQNYEYRYFTSQSEERAYRACDKLITCTRCGQQFIRNVTRISSEKIALISNGLPDLNPSGSTVAATSGSEIRILFVGSIVPGKGVFIILDALRQVVKAGYRIKFYMAGQGTQYSSDRITRSYPDVPTVLLGNVTFEQLQEFYRTSDIGIIGSVQEQNSYVAIEMAMFGLPIITTAVDGLDEMFTDRINALKIPVEFHPLKGIHVNPELIRERVIELIDHPETRKSLARGSRLLFEREYTLQRMTDRLLPVYESTLNEPD